MGGCAAMKLIDALLFLFFLTMAIQIPLFASQYVLPLQYYPKSLVEFISWYCSEYGDYLLVEKPHFAVGLVWPELLFTWPLCIACLVGLVSRKPWFNTTCLIVGVATVTSMAAIMAELIGSGRASETLLKIYAPFMVGGALAFLRGLIPGSSCTTAAAPLVAGKKKA